MDELGKAGRLKNRRKEGRGRQVAENMMQAGWLSKILWSPGNMKCTIPSQTKQLQYSVDLVRGTCSCPAAGITPESNETTPEC